ncbi:monocarboxylate transporter 9-like [Haliotis rufescens]|uniref:monocarboxylate transporter 9-like n=1 Tax=Haliotis rufescens TaxID=6454 RepID=UPI001EB00859|nr:monocarboxylate transporter 9-like [Haliotis rufescens]
MTRAIDSNDDCCCKDKKCEEEELPAPPRGSGPPDGGWGWMVVLASLLCNIIVDGICFTIATFEHQLMEQFNCNHAQAALIPSLLAGCYLTVGPLVSALASKYGCRKVTIMGSLIATSAFLLSTQASSIQMMIVTLGIMGGIGFGMIYLPAIVTVGFWFDKKRAFATGIAVCGSGVGTSIFAPFVNYLVEEYRWQGGLTILAGVVLNCVVCGALFRPLDKTPQRVPRRMVEIQRGSIMKALIEEKKRQRTISNGSLDNCIITKDNRLIKIDPSFFEAKRNNSFIARFKESLGFSTKSLDKSKQSLVIPSIKIDHHVSNGNCAGSQPISPIYRPSAKNMSQSSLSTSSDSGCNMTPEFILTAKSCDIIPGAMRRSSQDSDLNSCTQSMKSVNCPPMGASVISIQVVPTPPTTRSRHRAYRSSSSRSIAYASSGNMHPSSIVSGSVMSIPQYSVQTIDQYEEKQSTLRKVFYLLKEMFDFHLLKSPMFALLVFASILSMLAFFIPFFFLKDKAEKENISKTEGALILTVIGITNTLGRIISGWIADRPWADPLHLNNIALVIAGIATLMVPLCHSYVSLAIYGTTFGLCVAVFVSLRSILLVDLLGLDQLSKSFGILMLFQGVASMAGPPLAGTLLDSMKSVDVCFYLAGSLLALSGLLGIPLRRLKNWELNKQPARLPEEMPITETLRLEVESTI